MLQVDEAVQNILGEVSKYFGPLHFNEKEIIERTAPINKFLLSLNNFD